MASVESNSNDGIISRQLLKLKSGEFDLESIHSMKIKDEGISDLGFISECTALERLDLSYNNICRLHKLAGLTSLVKLNLSANRLTCLEGLQSLENLQSLNVSGNLIGSVDSLRCLAGLEKFTVIRLQDQSAGLTNPMCNTSYIDDVLMMLPILHTLDGCRVRGRGSEVYQLFQHMDKALKNISPPSTYEPVPEESDQIKHELNSHQWVVDNQEQDKVLEAEEQLQAMLASCRQLTKMADQTLYSIEVSQGQPSKEVL